MDVAGANVVVLTYPILVEKQLVCGIGFDVHHKNTEFAHGLYFYIDSLSICNGTTFIVIVYYI